MLLQIVQNMHIFEVNQFFLPPCEAFLSSPFLPRLARFRVAILSNESRKSEKQLNLLMK